MRRFFRFSIRDLLWLTLAAALLIGWRIDHSKLTAQQSVLEYNVELLKPYAKGHQWPPSLLS